MSLVVYEHIAINSIENVMLTISEIFVISFRTEAQTQEFVVDFLSGSKARFCYARLNEYSTYFPILVFRKTKHTVCTVRKILIVRFYAFKERSKVIVRVSEIVQFDDLHRIWRQIHFILRPTVEEIPKQVCIFIPTALLLCPLFEFYQLDRLASRCSRKSLNLLKDSSRNSGCAFQ